MAEEAKPKPKIMSTKFGAAFVGAWLPLLNQIADMGMDTTTLILIIIPLCIYLIVEGYLDGLRIKTGRGGPGKK